MTSTGTATHQGPAATTSTPVTTSPGTDLHGLLETTGLLPEQTLPSREIRSLEQRVLQNALDTSQRLDHVRAVVVQVPQLAVMALVRPPDEGKPAELISVK